MVAPKQWGEAYTGDGAEGPVLDLRHDKSGARVRVAVEYEQGHTLLSPTDGGQQIELVLEVVDQDPRGSYMLSMCPARPVDRFLDRFAERPCRHETPRKGRSPCQRPRASSAARMSEGSARVV